MEFCDIEIEGMRTTVTEQEIKTYKPGGNGAASDSHSHKYPDDFINKIICGDCLELIKSRPDKKICC